MKKTWVGYTRVSTAGQALEGCSLEAQAAAIVAYVAKKDPGAEVAVFEDAGVSGSSQKNRPGLAAALDSVKKSSGVLVVYSLSRLARSVIDASTIAADLEKKSCDLVLLSENLDTTTASGRMMFVMLAAFAQFERDLCSERTTMALRHKRASGKRTSCIIPFGFDLAADGKTLARNEPEQATLAEIREMRLGGMSLRAICRLLEDGSVKTRTGNATWTASTILKILNRKEHEQ